MLEQSPITVSAFYKFVPLSDDQITALERSIRAAAESHGVRGLILLAHEGVNATVAGTPNGMCEFKAFLRAQQPFCDLEFKDSPAAKIPFRRLAIQVREEIVTLKKDGRTPCIRPENRLAPKEWNRMLAERRDEITLIDVRNDYEVEVGRFRGAIDPKLKRFSDFPDYVRGANFPKNKPVLMYCTGGIRCEKAIEEMYAQGFEEVYQLDGGILKHFEECPHTEFEGECFIFDHRVAVDQQLQPTTTFHLCPHCGNPGTTVVRCVSCSKDAAICRMCAETPEKNSCSKNCAYHARRKSSPEQSAAHAR